MEDILASTEYARATAFAIDALLGGETGAILQSTNKSDVVVQNLARLAVRLQQFRQHSDQLGHWLRPGAAASASPKIEAVVAELARECRRVSVIIFNEVDRLSSGGMSGEALDAGVIAEYDAVLATFTRVFVFFTQILSA